MDKHADCRLARYLPDIERVVGPFTDEQRVELRILVDIQNTRIFVADIKRRERKNNSKDLNNNWGFQQPSFKEYGNYTDNSWKIQKISNAVNELKYFTQSQSNSIFKTGVASAHDTSARCILVEPKHHSQYKSRVTLRDGVTQTCDARAQLFGRESEYLSQSKPRVFQNDRETQTDPRYTGADLRYASQSRTIFKDGKTQTDGSDSTVEAIRLKDLLKATAQRLHHPAIYAPDYLSACIDELDNIYSETTFYRNDTHLANHRFADIVRSILYPVLSVFRTQQLKPIIITHEIGGKREASTQSYSPTSASSQQSKLSYVQQPTYSYSPQLASYSPQPAASSPQPTSYSSQSTSSYSQQSTSTDELHSNDPQSGNYIDENYRPGILLKPKTSCKPKRVSFKEGFDVYSSSRNTEPHHDSDSDRLYGHRRIVFGISQAATVPSTDYINNNVFKKDEFQDASEAENTGEGEYGKKNSITDYVPENVQNTTTAITYGNSRLYDASKCQEIREEVEQYFASSTENFRRESKATSANLFNKDTFSYSENLENEPHDINPVYKTASVDRSEDELDDNPPLCYDDEDDLEPLDISWPPVPDLASLLEEDTRVHLTDIDDDYTQYISCKRPVYPVVEYPLYYRIENHVDFSSEDLFQDESESIVITPLSSEESEVEYDTESSTQYTETSGPEATAKHIGNKINIQKTVLGIPPKNIDKQYSQSGAPVRCQNFLKQDSNQLATEIVSTEIQRTDKEKMVASEAINKPNSIDRNCFSVERFFNDTASDEYPNSATSASESYLDPKSDELFGSDSELEEFEREEIDNVTCMISSTTGEEIFLDLSELDENSDNHQIKKSLTASSPRGYVENGDEASNDEDFWSTNMKCTDVQAKLNDHVVQPTRKQVESNDHVVLPTKEQVKRYDQYMLQSEEVVKPNHENALPIEEQIKLDDQRPLSTEEQVKLNSQSSLPTKDAISKHVENRNIHDKMDEKVNTVQTQEKPDHKDTNKYETLAAATVMELSTITDDIMYDEVAKRMKEISMDEISNNVKVVSKSVLSKETNIGIISREDPPDIVSNPLIQNDQKIQPWAFNCGIKESYEETSYDSDDFWELNGKHIAEQSDDDGTVSNKHDNGVIEHTASNNKFNSVAEQTSETHMADLNLTTSDVQKKKEKKENWPSLNDNVNEINVADESSCDSEDFWNMSAKEGEEKIESKECEMLPVESVACNSYEDHKIASYGQVIPAQGNKSEDLKLDSFIHDVIDRAKLPQEAVSREQTECKRQLIDGTTLNKYGNSNMRLVASESGMKPSESSVMKLNTLINDVLERAKLPEDTISTEETDRQSIESATEYKREESNVKFAACEGLSGSSVMKLDTLIHNVTEQAILPEDTVTTEQTQCSYKDSRDDKNMDSQSTSGIKNEKPLVNHSHSFDKEYPSSVSSSDFWKSHTSDKHESKNQVKLVDNESKQIPLSSSDYCVHIMSRSDDSPSRKSSSCASHDSKNKYKTKRDTSSDESERSSWTSRSSRSSRSDRRKRYTKRRGSSSESYSRTNSSRKSYSSRSCTNSTETTTDSYSSDDYTKSSSISKISARFDYSRSTDKSKSSDDRRKSRNTNSCLSDASNQSSIKSELQSINHSAKSDRNEINEQNKSPIKEKWHHSDQTRTDNTNCAIHCSEDKSSTSSIAEDIVSFESSQSKHSDNKKYNHVSENPCLASDVSCGNENSTKEAVEVGTTNNDHFNDSAIDIEVKVEPSQQATQRESENDSSSISSIAEEIESISAKDCPPQESENPINAKAGVGAWESPTDNVFSSHDKSDAKLSDHESKTSCDVHSITSPKNEGDKIANLNRSLPEKVSHELITSEQRGSESDQGSTSSTAEEILSISDESRFSKPCDHSKSKVAAWLFSEKVAGSQPMATANVLSNDITGKMGQGKARYGRRSQLKKSGVDVTNTGSKTMDIFADTDWLKPQEHEIKRGEAKTEIRVDKSHIESSSWNDNEKTESNTNNCDNGQINEYKKGAKEVEEQKIDLACENKEIPSITKTIGINGGKKEPVAENKTQGVSKEKNNAKPKKVSNIWTKMMAKYDAPSKLEKEAKSKKWTKQRDSIANMSDSDRSLTDSESDSGQKKPGRTPFKALAINDSYVVESPSESDPWELPDYTGGNFIIPSEDDGDEIDKLLNQMGKRKSSKNQDPSQKLEQKIPLVNEKEIFEPLPTSSNITKQNLSAVGRTCFDDIIEEDISSHSEKIEVPQIVTKLKKKGLNVKWASDIVKVKLYDVETDESEQQYDYLENNDWELSDDNDDDNEYALRCAVNELNDDDTDIDEDFDDPFDDKACSIDLNPCDEARRERPANEYALQRAAVIKKNDDDTDIDEDFDDPFDDKACLVNVYPGDEAQHEKPANEYALHFAAVNEKNEDDTDIDEDFDDPFDDKACSVDVNPGDDAQEEKPTNEYPLQYAAVNEKNDDDTDIDEDFDDPFDDKACSIDVNPGDEAQREKSATESDVEDLDNFVDDKACSIDVNPGNEAQPLQPHQVQCGDEPENDIEEYFNHQSDDQACSFDTNPDKETQSPKPQRGKFGDQCNDKVCTGQNATLPPKLDNCQCDKSSDSDIDEEIYEQSDRSACPKPLVITPNDNANEKESARPDNDRGNETSNGEFSSKLGEELDTIPHTGIVETHSNVEVRKEEEHEHRDISKEISRAESINLSKPSHKIEPRSLINVSPPNQEEIADIKPIEREVLMPVAIGASLVHIGNKQATLMNLSSQKPEDIPEMNSIERQLQMPGTNGISKDTGSNATDLLLGNPLQRRGSTLTPLASVEESPKKKKVKKKRSDKTKTTVADNANEKPKEKSDKKPKEKVYRKPKEKVDKHPKEKADKKPKEKVDKQPKDRKAHKKPEKKPKKKEVVVYEDSSTDGFEMPSFELAEDYM